jgi:hypothetical protein
METETAVWLYMALNILAIVWAIMLLCIPFMIYSILQRVKRIESHAARIAAGGVS